MKRLFVILALCAVNCQAADVVLGRISDLTWTAGSGANKVAAWGSAWTPASLSPVAWYRLDGDALDSSTYANHGTLVNSPTNAVDRNGTLGGALGFGGTTRITIPNAAQIDAQNEVAIAFWVLPQSTTQGYVLSRNTNSAATTQYGVLLGSAANNVFFYLNGANRAAATAPASEWRHIVCVRDNTGAVSVYTNAGLAASATYTNALLSAPNVNIGARSSAADNSASAANFTGYLDDVLIFNRALTPAEITQLYNWRP